MEATVMNEQALEAAQAETNAAEVSNPLANIWLLFLGTLLGGTLLCTAVLVAWPIIANLTAG